MRRGSHAIRMVGILGYVLFLIVSVAFGFDPGKKIAINFASFSLEMLKVLPCAFILIGLFEVWVKRETVERNLGEDAGLAGYLWALLLAGTTVGGLYVAFPVASSLGRKGARLGVVFAYIGASAICRVPLAIFETSFLGVKFTAVRLLVSIPIVILTSALLGSYLARRGYAIVDGSVAQ
jgi:uncharacterized membrane protein YraQ (UPF0718 family)